MHAGILTSLLHNSQPTEWMFLDLGLQVNNEQNFGTNWKSRMRIASIVRC